MIEPLSKESKEDISVLPIFVIRKCKHAAHPCRIYIDHQLRVYTSLDKYIKNVQLHKCIMVLPRDAKYQAHDTGLVQLVRYFSPKCKLGSKLLTAADITTSVAGIGSGGAMAATLIPAVSLGPIGLAVAAGVGIGVGIYSVVRSGFTVADKIIHDEVSKT